MTFISFSFPVFFLIVAITYFLLPYRFRWILLLLASYVFYGTWKPVYVLLLLLTTAIDYYSAIRMDATSNERIRKLFLALSLISNIGTLFVFKYIDFFNETLQAVFGLFGHVYVSQTYNWVLPVGMSFYVFQSVGYIIDVYRKVAPAEKHFGIFALFVSFFPQLLAGPIERSHQVIPQYYQKHDFDYRRVVDALILITWGVFQKKVIADNLSIYLSPVYDAPQLYHGFSILLACFSYFLQIFFDFAAYSCIGIGVAQILGIRLMYNFDGPFFSRTISDLWQRWHVSFFNWLRSYIYMPLGSNKKGKLRWCLNIMIVFFISGLWHGANWSVVSFFMICSLYIVFVILMREPKKKLSKFFKSLGFPRLEQLIDMFLVFSLTAIAGILFRVKTFSDGVTMYINLVDFSKGAASIVNFNTYLVVSCIATAAILFLIWPGEETQKKTNDFFHSHGRFRSFLAMRPTWFRWSFYVSIVLAICVFGVFRSPLEFVYFKF